MIWLMCVSKWSVLNYYSVNVQDYLFNNYILSEPDTVPWASMRVGTCQPCTFYIQKLKGKCAKPLVVSIGGPCDKVTRQEPIGTKRCHSITGLARTRTFIAGPSGIILMKAAHLK